MNFRCDTRAARILLHAVRAGLGVLAAVLAWDANAGPVGALFCGALVAIWVPGARGRMGGADRLRRP